MFDTHADVAEEMASKIRSEIEQYEFPPVSKVTVSIGVAHYQDKDDRHSLLKRADKALYFAKEKGRNRMEVGKLLTDKEQAKTCWHYRVLAC